MKRLLLLLLFVPGWVGAQILDDTTQNRYGPGSTRFRREQDVYLNRDRLYTIDTSIRFYHQTADYSYRNDRPMMDLGNLGTALRPYFFTPREQLGIRSGYYAYNPYAFTAEGMQYFNTLSPYSHLSYMQGGNGRQILDAALSRNLDNRTNLGFFYKRITSQKQIGQSTPDERQADHHSVAVNGSHISNDGRWQLYAFYTHMNHVVNETGPIRPTRRDSTSGRLKTDSLFDYEQELIQLSPSARSAELRNDWHVYTQYALGGKGQYQVFYRLDRQRHTFSYIDRTPRTSTFYQNQLFFPSGFIQRKDSATQPRGWLGQDTVSHWNRYNNLDQQVGIKTQAGPLFLSGWVRARWFNMRGYYDVSYSGLRTSEYYVGGEAHYQPGDSLGIQVFAEAMPSADYNLTGQAQWRWLSAKAFSRKYSPTFQQNRFVGNLQEWYNDFSPTIATGFQGRAAGLVTPWLEVGADAQVTRLANYIYYNASSTPQQATEVVTPMVITGTLNVRWDKVHFDNQLYVTRVSGPDVIRMPPLFVWGRWYYENRIYKKTLWIQTGLDVRWSQAWYADHWNPTIQQWFIQVPNDPTLAAGQQPNFLLPAAAVADVFFNVGIKRAVVFLKLNNANQGLGSPGYFVAPLYPGVRRTFQFGLVWRFYD